MNTTGAGYSHPGYAESLDEFGTPRELPACGGWVLERPIPGASLVDAMGCYPFFACREWSRLREDLESPKHPWVTLGLVAEPFGAYEVADLRTCFDVVSAFKERFVIDCEKRTAWSFSAHHRRNAIKASKEVRVELCADPSKHLDEWTALYENLVARHSLKGVKAFSRRAFARQLALPGLVMFRATREGETLGLDQWYVQGDVAYGHLAAYSSLGYRLKVSYALKWHLIHYFADKVRWIDLGGGAGLGGGEESGLDQFKRGWATGTRPTYFCGRVLDRKRYAEILASRPREETSYFPAYRKGEFS